MKHAMQGLAFCLALSSVCLAGEASADDSNRVACWASSPAIDLLNFKRVPGGLHQEKFSYKSLSFVYEEGKNTIGLSVYRNGQFYTQWVGLIPDSGSAESISLTVPVDGEEPILVECHPEN